MGAAVDAWWQHQYDRVSDKLSGANEYIGRLEEECRQLRKELAAAQKELEWRRGRR